MCPPALKVRHTTSLTATQLQALLSCLRGLHNAGHILRPPDVVDELKAQNPSLAPWSQMTTQEVLEIGYLTVAKKLLKGLKAEYVDGHGHVRVMSYYQWVMRRLRNGAVDMGYTPVTVVVQRKVYARQVRDRLDRNVTNALEARAAFGGFLRATRQCPGFKTKQCKRTVATP